ILRQSVLVQQGTHPSYNIEKLVAYEWHRRFSAIGGSAICAALSLCACLGKIGSGCSRFDAADIFSLGVERPPTTRRIESQVMMVYRVVWRISKSGPPRSSVSKG